MTSPHFKGFSSPNRVLAMFLLSMSIFYNSFAQAGSSGAPFLTMPPSVYSIGMGEAGVALPEDDAFSFYHNPALLGLNGMTNNFAIGFYPSSVELLPKFNSDIDYYSLSSYVGYNLKNTSLDIPLSIGAGYMYQYLDMGEFTRTNENGQVLGKFNSYESASSFAIGAAYEYWATFSLGLTVKSINSKLAPIYMDTTYNNIASAIAFDLGLIALLPVVDSLELFDKMRFGLDVSLGYCLSNFGEELSYKYESEALPRTARIGYGIAANFNYNIKNTNFNVLKLDWTSEAEDLLVVRDSLGSNYQGIMGDINIIDNALLLKNSPGITVHHGWRVSLLEFVQFSGGDYSYKYIDDPNTNKFSTSGYAIQARGPLKLINTLFDSGALAYIADHFDVRYYHSKIKVTGEQDPIFDERDYSSIGVYFRNFIF